MQQAHKDRKQKASTICRTFAESKKYLQQCPGKAVTMANSIREKTDKG